MAAEGREGLEPSPTRESEPSGEFVGAGSKPARMHTDNDKFLRRFL